MISYMIIKRASGNNWTNVQSGKCASVARALEIMHSLMTEAAEYDIIIL